MRAPLLSARGLIKRFKLPQPFLDRVSGKPARVLEAIRGVSLSIDRGRTLAVIGESGCGKSTLGRTVLRLHDISAGRITFEDRDITHLSEEELRPLRARMQIVFQDPYASLNPRRTVAETMSLPLRLHLGLSRQEAEAKAAEFLPRVGLQPTHFRRYPHQFSGGQRQRIGIGRALILKPDLVVCDEPVSALDVSVQAQILELLEDFQDELGLSYLFISHDLGVVGRIADDIAVMYLGLVVESGPRDAVLFNPAHPYTRALLAATPRLRRRVEPRTRLTGDLPSPLDPPKGCAFHTRCPVSIARCAKEAPALFVMKQGHSVACHLREADGIAAGVPE